MDERVTFMARNVVFPAGRAEWLQLKALRVWGHRHWRFVADPYLIDAVTPAGDTLEQFDRTGALLGDCDCAAVCMGAMAMTIGVPVRLATCSFTEDLVHAHIWAEAGVPLSTPYLEHWLGFDVSAPRGRRPPMTDLAFWAVEPPR
jgi:hypothetical protein